MDIRGRKSIKMHNNSFKDKFNSRNFLNMAFRVSAPLNATFNIFILSQPTGILSIIFTASKIKLVNEVIIQELTKKHLCVKPTFNFYFQSFIYFKYT